MIHHRKHRIVGAHLLYEVCRQSLATEHHKAGAPPELGTLVQAQQPERRRRDLDEPVAPATQQ
jgi:hypothetical protein